MIFRRFSALVMPGLMMACGGGGELTEQRFPTGSQVMVASSDYSALYVAHPDQGSIARVGVGAAGSVSQIAVGEQPMRIARAGTRVAVTLRGDRSIHVLDEQGATLESVRSVELGAEPFGIVANEQGTRFWVSISLEDRVVELDAQSLTVLRSFPVKNQPRWLALHPSGLSLYVGSAMGGNVTRIDLEDATVHEISLPRPERFNANGELLALTPRVTGDLAVSPRGEELLVPMLYVDNTTAVAEADEAGAPIFPGETGGGYSQGGTFNPVVAIVPVESDGVPADEEADLVVVGGFTDVPVSGYPASVTVDPSSELAFVTLEGAGATIALRIEHRETSGLFDALGGAARAIAGPGAGSFDFRESTTIETGLGTRGAAFLSDDQAFVHSFLDRVVEALPVVPVRQRLIGEDDGDAALEDAVFAGHFESSNPVELGEEVLDPIVARGRRLFFAANDARVSTQGVGLSCATCHFDGRNDGLSWAFTRGARQTPSLAGKVSLTAPVRWQGDRITVAEDALMTSRNLMGGVGLTEEDARAIEAFIDSTPDVDVPLKGQLDDSALRGKQLFERPDVGCATCHNGERLTDNRIYPLLGLPQAKTRSLVGIAASAPYLHDGRAATLKELLIMVRDGSMGSTAALSDAELDDLVRYLETL